MIYVVMALYQEAHGLIRELELKKNTAYAPFEVFDNESAGIRLVVTGVGELLRLRDRGSLCAGMEQMRQTFSSISAAARQAAVNRQTGAWTAAARRQKARQVAVNRQTGIWTADTGRHTPHRSETCTCVTRSRSRQPGKRSIRIFCTGTRGRNVNL